MHINTDNLAAIALSYYGMQDACAEFIRHNENLVYSVTKGGERFVLRIKKPAQSMDISTLSGSLAPVESVASELAILNRLAEKASFPVQKPFPAKDGSLFCLMDDGSPVSLLRWIDGEPIGKDPGGIYARRLGMLAADIHIALSELEIPLPSYSHDRIAAMKDEIIAACVSDHITSAHCNICLDTLDEIDRVMTGLDYAPASKSVIHSDLGLGNVLVTPNGIAPIDFSLSGHGYRAHECGMIASNYTNPAHWQEIAEGYSDVSGVRLDPHHLDAFLSMSVLLFITAQHHRFHADEWFPKAMDRWCRTCFKRTIA